MRGARKKFAENGGGNGREMDGWIEIGEWEEDKKEGEVAAEEKEMVGWMMMRRSRSRRRSWRYW